MKNFLPALLWGITILILSTVGGVNPPNLVPDLLEPDKLGHAAAYAVLATLLTWGFVRSGRSFWQAVLWSTLFGVVYGLTMELVQYVFFPNRYFEVWDMAANTAGCLMSILVSFFIIK
ncbi:MAG: VanZ family protein [Saprospiraceae bacterium]